MQTSTAVKFAFGDDLRRVTLGTDVSLAEVQRAVRDRFGLRNVVGLTYEDDEGDVVTVGTDEELQEAFRLFRVLERCPRFVISETDTVFEEPETTEPETVVCETTEPECVTQPVEPVVVGTPSAPAEAEIEVALPDSTEVHAVIGDTSAQHEEIIEPDVIAVDIQRCPRKVLNGMWDRMASDANGHPVFQKQQESDQFFLYVRPTGRWVIDNHLLPEGTGPVFWHSLTGDLEGPWAKFPTWETLDTVRAMPIVHPDAPRMGVEDGDHDMQVVLDRDDRDFASGVYHRRENKNGHAHWTKRARCQKCGFSPAHFEQLAACPCGSTETVAPRELFFEPRRSWVIAPTTDLDEGAFYILKDGLQALGQPTQRWLGAVVRGSAEAPVFAFVRKPHRDGELSEEALQLLAMGYELHAVLKALQKHGNRVDLALDALA